MDAFDVCSARPQTTSCVTVRAEVKKDEINKMHKIRQVVVCLKCRSAAIGKELSLSFERPWRFCPGEVSITVLLHLSEKTNRMVLHLNAAGTSIYGYTLVPY